MKRSNIRLWTILGAVVGTLIMPSTWLFLFGMVAGAAIRDFTSGSATDPFEGLDSSVFGDTATTTTTLVDREEMESARPGARLCS